MKPLAITPVIIAMMLVWCLGAIAQPQGPAQGQQAPAQQAQPQQPLPAAPGTVTFNTVITN